MRHLGRFALAIASISCAAAQGEMGVQLDERPHVLDCDHLEFLKEARPIFFGSMTGVRIGISARKRVFTAGEPVRVEVWIDNRSDEPTTSVGGCGLPWHGGDVFDSAGRRLISIFEQRRLDAEKQGGAIVEACTWSALVKVIRPHACAPPVDAAGEDLTLDYDLQPGVYYVLPIHGINPALYKQGLEITVRGPSRR